MSKTLIAHCHKTEKQEYSELWLYWILLLKHLKRPLMDYT